MHQALPGARVKGTGFTAVLAVKAHGDPADLAAQATGCGNGWFGRVVAVLVEVPSARAQMLDAVARAAAGQVRRGESVCVRLRKRGAHGYLEPTHALERAAWDRGLASSSPTRRHRAPCRSGSSRCHHSRGSARPAHADRRHPHTRPAPGARAAAG